MRRNDLQTKHQRRRNCTQGSVLLDASFGSSFLRFISDAIHTQIDDDSCINLCGKSIIVFQILGRNLPFLWKTGALSQKRLLVATFFWDANHLNYLPWVKERCPVDERNACIRWNECLPWVKAVEKTSFHFKETSFPREMPSFQRKETSFQTLSPITNTPFTYSTSNFHRIPIIIPLYSTNLFPLLWNRLRLLLLQLS